MPTTESGFINKNLLRRVNNELARIGYAAWSGDNGQGSGYFANMLNYLEPADTSARKELFNHFCGSALRS